MKMNLLTILVFLNVCIILGSSERIVCYFLSWTIYRRDVGAYGAKDVDPTLCTHIVYLSIGLNDDGTVHVLDDWELNGLEEIKHLQALKNKNPDVKLIVSMGGWTEGSGTYSNVSANPDKRKVLVDSVLDFLGKNQFDGFDLDWEYPARRDDSDIKHDPDDYVILLGELKKALNAEKYIFSATVSGSVWYIIGSYPNTKTVSDNVDMLNVKAFDYHGAWWQDFVGHFSPLHASTSDVSESDKVLNVEAGIQHWLDYGADPSKINLGIGSYGRTYTLENPSKHDLYSPSTGPGDPGPYTREDGLLSYYEILCLYSNWSYVWDAEQEVPHRYHDNQWVGYEDEKSVGTKIEYAKEMKLGGVMFYSLDTDDFLGSCSNEPYPLLRLVNNKFT